MTAQEQQYIFDQWFEQYKALFFKIVRAYAFTGMDRDDLFQEIAIQAWHSIPSFRNESAVSTWLYRISLNTAIKWSQKERKHRDTKESLDSVAHVLHGNSQPMDERLVWLYEQISQLNPVDRSVTLLLLEGLSYKEMALILGITESNVGVKINRIKKHLADKSKKNRNIWNLKNYKKYGWQKNRRLFMPSMKKHCIAGSVQKRIRSCILPTSVNCC